MNELFRTIGAVRSALPDDVQYRKTVKTHWSPPNYYYFIVVVIVGVYYYCAAQTTIYNIIILSHEYPQIHTHAHTQLNRIYIYANEHDPFAFKNPLGAQQQRSYTAAAVITVIVIV